MFKVNMMHIDETFTNLDDHLRRVRGLEQPFELLIIRFSLLIEYYLQPKFLTLNRHYLQEDFSVTGKTLFSLPNKDIVLIYEKTNSDAVEQLFYFLRGLMPSDPLMNAPCYGRIDGTFMRLFDVQTQFKQINLELERLKVMVQRYEDKNKDKDKGHQSVGLDSFGDYRNHSLIEGDLTTRTNPEAEIERVRGLASRYQNLDITPLLLRQTVYRFRPDEESSLDFAFSILDPQIRQLMTYRDHRLDSDSTLLNRYLGHVIQHRLLDYIIKSDSPQFRRDMAFAVHPEMVLHPRFEQFSDLLLKKDARRIILQFELTDIYSDFRLYYFLSKHLHHRGFRIAISGVRYECLETLDLEALNADFVFVIAEKDWVYYDLERRHKMIQEMILVGDQKIVMTGIHETSLLHFAQKTGIHLLSGSAVDAHFSRQDDPKHFYHAKDAKGLQLGDQMRKRSQI